MIYRTSTPPIPIAVEADPFPEAMAESLVAVSSEAGSFERYSAYRVQEERRRMENYKAWAILAGVFCTIVSAVMGLWHVFDLIVR